MLALKQFFNPTWLSPAKAVLWCLLATSAALLGQDGLPIHVREGKTFTDTIFVFNQKVIVDGTVEGDLGAIGGDILITGKVVGNVCALNGSVILSEKGRVTGGVVCVSGQIQVPRREQVTGRIINYLNPEKDKGGDSLSSPKARAAVFFGQTCFLFLLIIATFYLFPNQIHEASFQLSHDLVRHVIVGTFTLTLFFGGMLVSFMMMVFGIGFPLFILFFCGLMVTATFGTVVVFFRLGQFLESLSGNRVALVFGLMVVTLLFNLLLLVPLVRSLCLGLLLLFGVGVVIETRFGTNKQWFTRKPRYWSAD